MLTMVNQVRAGVGSPPLRLSTELSKAAQDYSQVQADRRVMGHSVDGTDFSDRIKQKSYNGFPTAENVGEGYDSVADVVKGWIASPGHFKNLISPESTEVGLGVATAADGTQYWTQDFGKGNSGSFQPPTSTPAPKAAPVTKSVAPKAPVTVKPAPVTVKPTPVKPTYQKPKSAYGSTPAPVHTEAPKVSPISEESNATETESAYESDYTGSSALLLPVMTLLACVNLL